MKQFCEIFRQQWTLDERVSSPASSLFKFFGPDHALRRPSAIGQQLNNHLNNYHANTRTQRLRYPIIGGTLRRDYLPASGLPVQRYAIFHCEALEHSDDVILTDSYTYLVIFRCLNFPAFPTISSSSARSKMEPIVTIPDHSPGPLYSHSTMGDDSKPTQRPLRNSTKTDDPHERKKPFHHDSELLSGDIGFIWDDEEPQHPFRFLDLPVEIQLEVVDILSESYENYDLDAYTDCRGHPLLDLRQCVLLLISARST